MTDPALLTDFGKYRILEEIGSGGMGVVYRALDRDLGRTVAIKMLRPRADCPTDLDRFMREARTAARLQHPNIVPIHEVGNVDGRPYLAMDHIAGCTLADLISGTRPARPPAGAESSEAGSTVGRDAPATRSADGSSSPAASPTAARVPALPPLAPRAALELMRDVALAVDYAHGQGIIHRDLKPSNILVDEAARRPYITDFGLAREVLDPERITLSGTILGTPQYMAPEQADAREDALSAAADLWSLGAILYEVLTGGPPFDGRGPVDVVYKLLHEDPDPPMKVNPRVHRDLDTVVLKCLEKDPRRRYASARDLADDLGRFLAGEPILARPVGPVSRLVQRAARHRGVTVALGFALLAVAASAGWLAWDAAARRREARALLADGLRGLEAGDPESAVRALSDAAALRRDDPEITRWLAAARKQSEERRAQELGSARQAALAEQAERRARALPHYLKGEELREKAATLVRMGTLDDRPAYLRDAEQAYARAIELDAEFAEACTGRGRILVELGDVARAHVDLARAIRLGPEHTEAYRARLMLRSEEYETLWTSAGRVQDSDIGSITALPDLTGVPEAEALRAAIAEDIRAVLALGVRPEETRYFEGWLQRIAGDLDAAYRSFDESIALWRYYAPAYEGRATIRLLRLDPDVAAVERDLDEALRLDPGFFRARFIRFFHLVRQKEFLRALAEVDLLLELRPRFAPVFLVRGYIKRRFLQDAPGAMRDFREAAEHDPRCLLAYVNTALMLHFEGKSQEAVEEFGRALLVSDRYAIAYYHRAGVLRALKRTAEAEADLDRTIELDPGFAPAYQERARVHLEAKRMAEALVDLAKARELNPQDADAFHLTANALVMMGRLEDALPYYGQAIEREPDEPMFHFNRALIRLKLGDPAGAVEGFEKVLAMNPSPTLRASTERRLAEARAAGGK